MNELFAVSLRIANSEQKVRPRSVVLARAPNQHEGGLVGVDITTCHAEAQLQNYHPSHPSPFLFFIFRMGGWFIDFTFLRECRAHRQFYARPFICFTIADK